MGEPDGPQGRKAYRLAQASAFVKIVAAVVRQHAPEYCAAFAQACVGDGANAWPSSHVYRVKLLGRMEGCLLGHLSDEAVTHMRCIIAERHALARGAHRAERRDVMAGRAGMDGD